MEEYNQAIINPIYSALTRPATILGVNIEFFAINISMALCMFIICSSIVWLLVAIPLHAVAWILYKLDPYIITIINKKIECLPVANKKLWGCNSYAPY